LASPRAYIAAAARNSSAEDDDDGDVDVVVEKEVADAAESLFTGTRRSSGAVVVEKEVVVAAESFFIGPRRNSVAVWRSCVVPPRRTFPAADVRANRSRFSIRTSSRSSKCSKRCRFALVWKKVTEERNTVEAHVCVVVMTGADVVLQL
jgi:hypothetical protein